MTATAALDLIREQDFGAIISDLRMPSMDGPAFRATVCDEAL